MDEKWLTLTQASKHIGCTPRTVRVLGQRGVLTRKLGQPRRGRGPYLYSLESCERYLTDRRPPEGCVSVKEAADKLDVDPQTVIRRIGAGELEAVKGAASLRGLPPWWVRLSEAGDG